MCEYLKRTRSVWLSILRIQHRRECVRVCEVKESVCVCARRWEIGMKLTQNTNESKTDTKKWKIGGKGVNYCSATELRVESFPWGTFVLYLVAAKLTNFTFSF